MYVLEVLPQEAIECINFALREGPVSDEPEAVCKWDTLSPQAVSQ